MDLATFKATLDAEAPPDGISNALASMWHEAKGDWGRAHELAQAQGDAVGSWIHAYLHRVEGDTSNAAYWYRRAGKAMPDMRLADEWDAIVSSLL